MDTKTDGPACLRRRHGMKAHLGARASRPHNTGTASPISPTRLDRQRRRDSASAEPMGFPPAGWPCSASRGNGAATQRRGCGRDARAPGGAPPPILRKYPFDIGCHTPRSTTHRSIHWCSFVSIGGSPFPVVDISFPFVSFFVSLRCPSCDFVALSFFCFRQAPPLPCRADHPRVKHSIVNKGEPRIDTNVRWTCLAATTSREEGRERGRPARTTLARLHASLPPGSTGNGATIPFQPSPGGSRRLGGRVPHHGETERPPNPEDAGETPALPVGRLLPSFVNIPSISVVTPPDPPLIDPFIGVHSCPLVVRRFPSWISLSLSCHSSCLFVVLRVTSWLSLFFVSGKHHPCSAGRIIRE